MNVSYLNTKVSEEKFLAYTRDPGAGRSDAVIIKDISNGSNCAIVPKTAGSTAAVTHVATVNSVLGLRAPTAFPADGGVASLGAFSICNQLNSSAFPTKAGVDVLFEGVPVNIEGNELPQAPNFKFSTGVQYTFDFNNGMSLVPRFDYAFTGDSWGSVFNTFVNKVDSFAIVNMQVQLNSADNKWWVRGYVQNLLDNSATTGLYVTDQSSGLFTNIFTLEPRRYGIAIGANF
jgi:outer membrane receptor protein involved in Fe transport